MVYFHPMNAKRAQIVKYYQHMQVDTASRPKQIVMLHDRLYVLIRDAIFLKAEERRDRLDKAQNIIAQLQTALKIESEDEVANSLFLLYDYVYVQLETDDDMKYRDAIRVVQVVRDTFAELFNQK